MRHLTNKAIGQERARAFIDAAHARIDAASAHDLRRARWRAERADELRAQRALRLERSAVLAEVNAARATVPRPFYGPTVRPDAAPLPWRSAALAWIAAPSPRPALDLFGGPDAVAAAAHLRRIAALDSRRNVHLPRVTPRFLLDTAPDRCDMIALGPNDVLVPAGEVTPLAPVGRSERRRRVFRSAPVWYRCSAPVLLLPGHRPVTVDRLDRDRESLLSDVPDTAGIAAILSLVAQAETGIGAAADGLWLTAPREPSQRWTCSACGARLRSQQRCNCWLSGTDEQSRSERSADRIRGVVAQSATATPVVMSWTIAGGLLPRRALRTLPTAALPPSVEVECRACAGTFRRERRAGRPTIYCPPCRSAGRRVRR